MPSRPCPHCGWPVPVSSDADLVRCPNCLRPLEVYTTLVVGKPRGVAPPAHALDPANVHLRLASGDIEVEPSRGRLYNVTVRGNREGTLDLQTLSSSNVPGGNQGYTIALPRSSVAGFKTQQGSIERETAAQKADESAALERKRGSGFLLLLGIALLLLALAGSPELAAAFDTMLHVVP